MRKRSTWEKLTAIATHADKVNLFLRIRPKPTQVVFMKILGRESVSNSNSIKSL